MQYYKKIKLRNGKTIDEHRLVAGVSGFNTVVHHIDGNKRNNSPENLQVMTRSEHCKVHGFGGSPKKFAPDKYGNAVCRVCGCYKPIEHFKKDSTYTCGYASICKPCFNEYKRNLRKLGRS